MRVAALVLAAGASRRMGRAKLPLALRGLPLVAYAAKAALESRAARCAVVTGCAQAEVRAALRDGLGADFARLEFAPNPSWREGMAASLRAGVRFVCSGDAAPDGVVLLLGDQPYLSTALINRLIELGLGGGDGGDGDARLAACNYGASKTGADVLGPPVFFPRRYFARLQQLRGDIGAQQLLREAAAKSALALAPFPAGLSDLNTPAEFAAAQNGAAPG